MKQTNFKRNVVCNITNLILKKLNNIIIREANTKF